jgi:MraZ protein
MLTGEFRVAVDDKGRLLIPARLRGEIPGNTLIVTRGIENCLWVFLPEEWAKIADSLMRAGSPLQANARLLQRHIIAPAQDIELDKTGRLNLPATLQESAGLKKECIILGLMKYMEIWDVDAYQAYTQSTQDDFKNAAEELGGSVSFFGSGLG